MIDITKEEFLKSNYVDIEKAEKGRNKIKDWIVKNKFITIACAFYITFAGINLFLAYAFFKLFLKL